MQRLGKNINSYVGETIDIRAVLQDCLAASRAHGWILEQVHPEPRRIIALVRHVLPGAGQKNRRVYISTGIHGDEPAGPLAARQLLQDNQWPPGLELCLCPCLNPTGFPLNRRENVDGVDLNREYLHPGASEILAHTAWLKRQPNFDVCFCLHEDWESHGFYVYELNPDNVQSLAGNIVAGVATVCPVDTSETIEGRPAKNGIIRPDIDPRSRPQWPEAFFLLAHKTRRSYTLEAPSDFPLATRVAALVTGLKAALETFVHLNL
jgi:hypothetical protein